MSTPQPASSPLEVQRVAVRVVDAVGRVQAATWLRHADTPLEVLARLLDGVPPERAAALELTAASTQARDLPELGLRLHVVSLDHTLPDDLAHRHVGRDETLDPHHLRDALGSWADDGRIDPLGGQRGTDLLKVQRTGAYAVILDAGRALLTELSRTRRWTLPGGGIDLGEQPVDSLRREVHEETGLPLKDIRLAGVNTTRWDVEGPSGTIEDFQSVQILYTAAVPTEVAPRVVEVDGSTSDVAWVPFGDLRGLSLTYVARSGLALAGVGEAARPDDR